jgi:hypothetical protein
MCCQDTLTASAITCFFEPQTLVINCAMSNPSQVAFWEPINTAAAAAAAAATPRGQPQQQPDAETPKGSSTNSSNAPVAAKGGSSSSSPFSSSAGGQQQQQQHAESSWLPWVLQVRSNPATSQVDVITADTLAELADNTRHRESQTRTFNCVVNLCCGAALRQPLVVFSMS